MRIFAAIALLMITAACSSKNEEREGYYVGHRFLGGVDESAMTSEGWMNPKTLQIHTALTSAEEGDMSLPGVIVGYHFMSTGDIRGDIQAPPVPGRCKKVSLMLRDRRLIPEGEPRPEGEYLKGLFDPETTLFYPQSRQVIRPTPVVVEPS